MAGKFITSFITLALIVALMAGCGNKGDLVLPDADSARDTPPAQNDSRY
jgi:predicted small lipoprotein YifL